MTSRPPFAPAGGALKTVVSAIERDFRNLADTLQRTIDAAALKTKSSCFGFPERSRSPSAASA
jgi:hypothetical protein